MAVMTDKYPNLPGHLTEFKDGGLQLVQEVNPPATESVLILGTAVDGPVMEPVKVDPATYEAVFGKCADDRGIPNGATASLAFEEAYAAGCRDIRIMRISGAPASAILKCSETERIEDKVFEGILGRAVGNDETASIVYLSSTADEVLSVEASGVLLKSTDYKIVKSDVVDGQYTDGNEIYSKDELEVVKVIPGTKTVVEIATESIYAHITNEGEFKWESEILAMMAEGDGLEEEPLAGPNPDDYVIVTQAGVDYVVKGEVDAALAYVVGTKEGTFKPSEDVALDGVVLDPAKTTKVTVNTNVTDAGAMLKVTYKTGSTVKVENASIFTPMFLAGGIAVEYAIADDMIPEMGTTRIYIDGAEYLESDTTVEDAKVKVFTVERGEFEIDEVACKAKIVLNPGSHAKRNAKIETRFGYKETIATVAELKLETSFGGSVYNETQYNIKNIIHAGNVMETVVEITKPRSKRSQASEAPLTFSSFDWPTLGLLARAINNSAANGLFVKAYINEEYANVETGKLLITSAPVNFNEGDDGVNLSKQQLFEKLAGKRDAEGYLVETGAYQLLENYTVDYVVPVGVNADDKLVGKFDNFAYELALFCAVASHRNHATMGVIATSSPTEPTLKAVEEHVKKLEAFENIYYMRDSKGEVIRDVDNNAIDLGKYLSVIAGGDIVLNSQRLGQYSVNSPAAFAGFLSQLAVNSAPTNKVLKYARGLRVKYSNAQLDRLTANRYITLKYKGDGTTVAVVDAMQASAPGSDYERTATMRAVRELANEIREVADPFLGEPNTTQQRNALSALLDKRLGQHKEAGTMKDYGFQLLATPYDELVGQATIELTIVPAQELRRITTVISLKPSI